jgi:antagonist of KipI
MSLFIEKSGLLTTVQDLGRYGLQKYGVIVSGAMDPFALRAANILVGNQENAAGLEITMMGPEIIWESSSLIAICGGDLSATINGVDIPLWRSIYILKGSRLQFGRITKGCRTYLAVAGGLDVPIDMNSRSTYLRAGLGGYSGRALQEGDRISLLSPNPLNRGLMNQLEYQFVENSFAISPWSVSYDLLPAYDAQPLIQVTTGTEFSLFDEESLSCFFNELYQVLPQSDRMGYRLSGSELKLTKPSEMISASVTFGTIQVPSDGKPIVLMADRQTTGGYPKIAQVISSDLPLLAQVNLNGKVRFQLVSLKEAQNQYIKREMNMKILQKAILIQGSI